MLVECSYDLDVIMEDGNDDNEHAASNFLTPDEFLKLGLKLVGYTKRRIQRSKKRSNVERFLGHFGSIPCVCASIYGKIYKQHKLKTLGFLRNA
jgi:hypothetical protein